MISRTVNSDVKEEQPVVESPLSPEKKAPSKVVISDQANGHVDQAKQNVIATKHLLTPMSTSPKSTILNQVKMQGTIQIN